MPDTHATPAPINTGAETKADQTQDDSFVGSPMKKHRGSVAFDDASIQQRLGAGMGSAGPIADILGAIGGGSSTSGSNTEAGTSSRSKNGGGSGSGLFGGELGKTRVDEDEEL